MPYISNYRSVYLSFSFLSVISIPSLAHCLAEKRRKIIKNFSLTASPLPGASSDERDEINNSDKDYSENM